MTLKQVGKVIYDFQKESRICFQSLVTNHYTYFWDLELN